MIHFHLSEKCKCIRSTSHIEGLFITLTRLSFGSQECRNCHQDIYVGSAYVLAFSLGENAAWHPQCFSCTKCNELLMNLTFYQSDADIFCGRHYAEINKPRCGACDEVNRVVKFCYSCAHPITLFNTAEQVWFITILLAIILFFILL